MSTRRYVVAALVAGVVLGLAVSALGVLPCDRARAIVIPASQYSSDGFVIYPADLSFPKVRPCKTKPERSSFVFPKDLRDRAKQALRSGVPGPARANKKRPFAGNSKLLDQLARAANRGAS